jgi:hypothetical protein
MEAADTLALHRWLAARLLGDSAVVIVQEHGPGAVEVATIDPTEAMTATGNEALRPLAETVRDRLAAVLANL